MRFLHVISSVDRRGGGPVEALRQIGLVHRDLGHTVEAASLDAPDSPELTQFPFKLHALGPGRSAYAYAPRMTHWLKVHGSGYDAVIVHGLWQYHAHAVQAALSGRVPYFVYTHGMLDPWFNEQFPLKHVKKMLFWHLTERRILDEATSIIFTAEEEMERSIRSFFPFRWKGIVAPLGIAEPEGNPEAQKAAFLARFPELRNRPFLLFFGRLHPKKGCDLLLKAVAKVAPEWPDLHLVMAGPSDQGYLQGLQQLADEEGIGSRVTWTGMITGDLKWGVLQAADAFILPSHQENFAIAAAEAMAVGTPVLLSDKVQIWREVLRSGAGLVESDSPSGTEQLLRRWMSMAESRKSGFRTAAVSCYRNRFTAREAGIAMLNQVAAKLRSSVSICH
jgi:glycosyltransferase involved in cell wall biosynthesis